MLMVRRTVLQRRLGICFFFFKQKSAYEMRISDWSSDVCSSDLHHVPVMLDTNGLKLSKQNHARPIDASRAGRNLWDCLRGLQQQPPSALREADPATILDWAQTQWRIARVGPAVVPAVEPQSSFWHDDPKLLHCSNASRRSEEHTSEIQ